jgi:PmbA protein
MTNNSESIERLAKLVLKEVEHRGAKTADVLARRIREDSITVRQQQVETVRRRITQGIGLRVILEGRLGFAHSTEVSEGDLVSLVDKAIALAKETSSDPGHGIAELKEIPPHKNLDLIDDTISHLNVQEKIDQVMRLEKAMLSADSRIARSIGADWHDSDDLTVLINTNGLSYHEFGTGFALVGQAVAEQDGQMQRGFWWSQARHREDLDSPEVVGTKAGKRAVELLGAKSIPTIKAPVVFEAPIASQVLSVLFAAIDGEKIRKRSSYLVDQLNQQVASPLVTVIDDGHLPRKLGTQAIDDEGTPACRKILMEKGILKQYIYDIRGARLSHTSPTGNAHRSYGSLPSAGPTNLYLEPGKTSLKDVIKSVEKGLFLTRIMGSGVNLVTGDVSWGASGIWIENGELAFPVERMTIAGNLLNLWCDIDVIADDLEWNSNVVSPTFRVKEMMIGGK